ncbi:adenine deaminase [Dyadobacter sp. Leaf189]|uniref:adenine deaminase n=1 Tax=Dyadobacter sp. Leaf189 TaxID=1736295 RepID=UPI000A524E8B|nr:adenine deaminase [Dyadobacter sp. Leaf189]
MKVNIVDIQEKLVYAAELEMAAGRIVRIENTGQEDPHLPYAMPGFIDAHVHIESAMLTPAQFARLAVVHGTVATVSDPHEIGNVLGLSGVEFMIEDGKRVPFKFCFGAPSCVPATVFETAGATIDAEQVGMLLAKPEIGYLAEVMNFPGVLNEDPDMMQKIAWAKHYNKVIDGHAPGLRGEAAKKYASNGISTDHECFTYEEAREKIDYGVKILLREGSAARNFDALIPLIAEFPEYMMFCSDDKHPDNLVEGHINVLVKRALALGYNLWDVLLAACINPVLHYKLPVGLLKVDDPADMILVNNLNDFRILETRINGETVAENGKTLIYDLRSAHPNHFECSFKNADEFGLSTDSKENEIGVRVIEVFDGQLITGELNAAVQVKNGKIAVDIDQDILKIAVVNRYSDIRPAVALIRNFGLKSGAIASSVAHDSHNIIAVGTSDEAIAKAVNLIIGARGGVSAVGVEEEQLLALPIAGLMSDEDGYKVAAAYTEIDQFVKDKLKSTLKSPFMSLSFMALLVIPALKLSDKGLFDGANFNFVPLSIR